RPSAGCAVGTRRSGTSSWTRRAAPRVAATGTAVWTCRVAAMVRWRSGTVSAVRRRGHGAVEIDAVTPDGPVRALAYPALVGEPAAGDRVLLNVGALTMGLGTGGYALVIALPDRLPPDPIRERGAR